jgi:hypothetical protein
MSRVLMAIAALGQIPAGLYLLLDTVILRDNTPVLGSRFEETNTWYRRL